MDEIYEPNRRIHNLAWIITHAKNLRGYAIEREDTSLIIYCCLELRNALEILELLLLLASVEEETRVEILNIAKPKNGIEKANNKLKTLKHKYQEFHQAVCIVTGQDGVYFNFTKSDNLKYNLSQYIHTYTREESEMYYGSTFIQDAFPLIEEVIEYLEKSLLYDGISYTIQNLGSDTLEPEDMRLLDEWKKGAVKTFDELLSSIRNNISSRALKYNKCQQSAII